MDGATSLIGEVSVDKVLGPGEWWAGNLLQGSALRVIDLENQQVARFATCWRQLVVRAAGFHDSFAMSDERTED